LVAGSAWRGACGGGVGTGGGGGGAATFGFEKKHILFLLILIERVVIKLHRL